MHPCRVGTRRLLEMLEQITAGNGTVELLREMEELCYYIKANSLCALGQSAPNPVLSTLHYFRDEYEAHCIENAAPPAFASGWCGSSSRRTSARAAPPAPVPAPSMRSPAR